MFSACIQHSILSDACTGHQVPDFAAVKEPNPVKGLLCTSIISHLRKTNNNKQELTINSFRRFSFLVFIGV